jgi:hypothetical protein
VTVIALISGCAAVGAAAAILPPAASVGLVVACCSLPILMLRPVIAVYAGIALVSVDHILVMDIGQASMKASHILFAIGLLGTLAERASNQEALLRIPTAARRVLIALLILVATQVLSFLAGWPGSGVAASRIAIMLGGAMVPCVAIILAVDSPSRFRNAVTVFLISQVCLAVLGLYEFAASHLGLPPLIEAPGVVAGASRVAGLSLEPGYYAVYLAAALPLTTFLLLRPGSFRGPDPRIVAATLLLAITVANSRAGYLLTIITVLATILLLSTTRHIHLTGLWRIVTTATATIVCVAVVSSLSGVPLSGVIATQLRNATISPTSCLPLASVNNACISNIQRSDLYTAGQQIFLDHPVLGVGDGRAGEFLPRYGVDLFVGREATVQNVVLDVATESGIVGLAALMFLWWRLFAVARPTRHDDDDRLIARMLLVGGLVMVTFGGIVLLWLFDVRVWALFGLGLAGLAAHGGPPKAPSGPGQSRAPDTTGRWKPVSR